MLLRPKCFQKSTPIPSRKAFTYKKIQRRYYSGKENDKLILAIESSCDDTGVAVVSSNRTILSNVIAKQGNLAALWGVVPKLACREHARVIDAVVDSAIETAQVKWSDISAIAVTKGPGLVLCLDVGLEKALSLSKTHNIPMMPMHHMEGHALVAKLQYPQIKFPYLTLLVSGGHTQLTICHGIGDYQTLGDTLDNAVGETFDKLARELKLDLANGGGREIEERARIGDYTVWTLPEGMHRVKTNCRMSFSGILTAAVNIARSEEFKADPANVNHLAASYQHYSFKQILSKLELAMAYSEEKHDITTLVVSGGVASNQALRNKLATLTTEYKWQLYVPGPELCTDNGVMIAWAAHEYMAQGRGMLAPNELEMVRTVAKWPLDSSNTDYFEVPVVKMSPLEKRRIATAKFEAAFRQLLLNPEQTKHYSFYVKNAERGLKLKLFEDTAQFCVYGLQAFPDSERLQMLKTKSEMLARQAKERKQDFVPVEEIQWNTDWKERQQ